MKDDKPAFPGKEVVKGNYETNEYYREGMTLKEYYIGCAITGLCAGKMKQGYRAPFEDWVSDKAIKIAEATIKKLD